MRVFVAAALLCLVSAGAEAKQSSYPPVTQFNGDRYAAQAQMGAEPARPVQRAGKVIGGRPAGCPSRFCGCGASLHLFGRIIPALNLAANWLRFPRAAPGPDMAAARHGHVFVLKQHIRGNLWLVYDANSGGRQTRMHQRSIAGFTIVNPHRSNS